MGLKLLHSADWHLDSPFAGFSKEQQELLKQEQQAIPGKIADLCRRETCDLVLLAGDLFDAQPSRDTLQQVKKALEQCRVPVMIAPGNHDFCAPESPWLTESWPSNVHIFTTAAMDSVSLPELNCRVYGAGFQSMDCSGLLENFHAQGSEQYQLAVVHGDPTQNTSAYNPITASQVRKSGLNYLALGHIHKAGAFRSGDTICAWPGCPMGRGWDETGEKGVCIVTLEETADIQAVSLDTLGFYQLQTQVGADPLAALEGVLPAGGSRDFFRITLTGYGEPDLEKLKKSLSAFPNLELVDQTRPPLDVWADAGEDTLEGVYFHMLRSAKELNPEHADQIQLAAEISRKLLNGWEVTL